MTLQEIQYHLLQLTFLRKKLNDIEGDDNIYPPPYHDIKERHPIWQEIDTKRADLEQELEKFFIVWDPINRCYGLIPKFE